MAPNGDSAATAARVDELLAALQEIADFDLVTRSFADYRDSFMVLRDIARQALEDDARPEGAS